MRRLFALALAAGLLMAAKPPAVTPSIVVNEPGPYVASQSISVSVELPKLKGEQAFVILFCDWIDTPGDFTGMVKMNRVGDQYWDWFALSGGYFGPKPYTLWGAGSGVDAWCRVELVISRNSTGEQTTMAETAPFFVDG